MKLSVVVPVYKVEDTLERCVESIVKQGVPDMEVILVDDGSPDGCPQLCEDIAAKNKCIRVIHKKNGGLSSARNAGIAIAKGEYITFVDSDDFVGEGTYIELLKILEKHSEYDILEFPVMDFYGSPKQCLLKYENKSYSDMIEYWLKGRAYEHTYAWNKFYRRHLFDEVKYPEGLVFEDVWTMPLLLKHARCVATCDKGLYYYCLNENGITSTANEKHWKMLLDAHIAALKILDLPRGLDFLRYYISIVNTQILVYEYNNRKVTMPKYKIGKEMFSYLRATDVDIRLKIKCIIIKIFNLNILCRLNNMLFKIQKGH